MILDKDYDNSLWYMMLARDKNADELLAFLKSLPKGLMDTIKSDILRRKNGNYTTIDALNGDHYYEDPKDPSIYYYYNLEADTGAVIISKSMVHVDNKGMDFVDDEDFDDVADLYELTLFPMSKEEPDDLNIGEAIWYGAIKNFREEEFNYHIERTDNNFQLVCAKSLFFDSSNLPGVIPVDLNDLPDDLTYDNVPQRRLQ